MLLNIIANLRIWFWYTEVRCWGWFNLVLIFYRVVGLKGVQPRAADTTATVCRYLKFCFFRRLVYNVGFLFVLFSFLTSLLSFSSLGQDSFAICITTFFAISNFRVLSFSSALTRHPGQSYVKMLKLLLKRKSPALNMHLYPREGMEVMGSGMLTEQCNRIDAHHWVFLRTLLSWSLSSQKNPMILVLMNTAKIMIPVLLFCSSQL